MADLLDDRFRRLREGIARHREIDDERPDPADDRLQAAVSVVLRAGEGLDLLLIKRATSERDRWSGQMALPGGRWERQDSGLLTTATRETLEETGVDLDADGVVLGRLPDMAPSSPRLPRMRIAPYVFGVPAETGAVVASYELDSVHWVPLDLLASPDVRSTVEIEFPDARARFPSFSVVGEHVWGLTHRILTDFLERYSRV